ncbi:hypothetical protein [Micromonospora sp. L32]|uniref:hypothetical protein n=1 Tax=Micromonospora sp. L32 TaxID=3452214 RepID=UPI003F8B264C
MFAEFHRVLRPGGVMLLGFHAGDGSRLKTEGYGGYPMNVYVHRRPPGWVTAWLDAAGFTVEAEMLHLPAKTSRTHSSSPIGEVPGRRHPRH